MRRKKLLPKPKPPPEGYMFWYGKIILISHVESAFKSFYNKTRPYLPDWRDDPTYNMKINKRRKQDVV